MRARALSHCCCPPGPAEHARLTCCTTSPESSIVTNAREQTERPQLAPIIGVVAHVQPRDGLLSAAIALPRGLPASTAAPPFLLPLRV